MSGEPKTQVNPSFAVQEHNVLCLKRKFHEEFPEKNSRQIDEAIGIAKKTPGVMKSPEEIEGDAQISSR